LKIIFLWNLFDKTHAAFKRLMKREYISSESYAKKDFKQSVNSESARRFRFLAASGHQQMLWTAKRSAFQPASIKFVGAKTIQNQHKHIIGWVVVIVGIRHFLDPEPYEQLYLPPHVMIFRFSPQPNSSHSQIFRKAGQKKAEPNRRDV
jgi:hypothetical protein